MSDLPVYLSLGAGVQSSTLALMLAAGELPDVPRPAGAIFADTQAEPAEVYRWLDWLEPRLPFPVHRVTKGSLAAANLLVRTSKRNGKQYVKHYVPTFSGNGGVMPRKCTADYKLRPIQQTLRRLAKVPRGTKVPVVVSLIGISRDEAHRMKPSREPWIENRWPLVDAGITRKHCLEWMAAKGHPKPPRSACVFCPYHSNAEWRRLRDEDAAGFAAAVGFERSLNEVAKSIPFDVRKGRHAADVPHPGEFLHAALKPLDAVDLRTDVERGQGTLGGWGNECEGLCGV